MRATDVAAVAGALSTQGLDLHARPGLHAWPTVTDMCARIAATYGALGVIR